MQLLIIILHVFVATSLIGLVLLQHGKGADVGAAFGSGASNTMFGSAGATPFLIKVTGVLAAVFFATSLALSYLAVSPTKAMESVIPSSQTVPVPVNTEVNPPSVPSSD